MVLEAHLPYAWIEIDSSTGETRTARVSGDESERQSAGGRKSSPACILAGIERDHLLSRRLASPLLPGDRLLRARVSCNGSSSSSTATSRIIAVARFLRRFHPDPPSQRALADSQHGRRLSRAGSDGRAAGATRRFWSAVATRIADIALRTRTRTSPTRAGSTSRGFPQSAAWLARVAASARLRCHGRYTCTREARAQHWIVCRQYCVSSRTTVVAPTGSRRLALAVLHARA